MCDHCVSRREFTAMTTAALAGGMLGLSSAVAAEGPIGDAWNPDKPPVVTGRPLRVQPILAHNVMRPLENVTSPHPKCI